MNAVSKKDIQVITVYTDRSKSFLINVELVETNNVWEKIQKPTSGDRFLISYIDICKRKCRMLPHHAQYFCESFCYPNSL